MTGDRDAKRLQDKTTNRLLTQVQDGDRENGMCRIVEKLLLFARCHLEDALLISMTR